MEPKFILIVKVPNGLRILNAPRPISQGARVMRNVSVGASLEAYDIHNIGGVDYARLVPQNPQRPEWVRMAEADHSIEYVDVIELESNQDNRELANAILSLADAVRELAKSK